MSLMSINIIETTDPKDRPTEAVEQLRDIAEWLRNSGFPSLAENADDLADEIVARVGV